MGKRAAAAKPKAAAGAAAAGASKRQKVNGSHGVPLPPAPESWGRPPLQPEALDGQRDLQFFLVDVEDGPAPGGDGLEHEVRLFGTTAAGNSLCARVRGVRPYFYARCPAGAAGREEDIRAALCLALPKELRGDGAVNAVVSVEVLKRTPVLGYQQEGDYLKIVVAGPRALGPCVRAVESGLRVPGPVDGSAGPIDLEGQGGTFEANIPLVLRFLVDQDLGGGRWIQLAKGGYSLVAEPRLTSAQAELEVHVDSLSAVSLDAELGSSIPPVRFVAIEAITLAEPGAKAPAAGEGALRAVACSLHVHGEPGPQARAVWLCQAPTPAAPAGEAGQAAPAPRCFVSEDAGALVDHLGSTLASLDADVLIVYDCFQVVRGLLGKKGVAKPGSALARGLARRLTSEVKLTQKSNEVSGITGRLVFDLQKQVEKEHRLVDYSLGSLLEHFCKAPLPELRESSLAKLHAARPRALAEHALRRAEASMQLFDRLAYLFNFVEMARVTGCPLGYLLERGQAVKVQAQLLREAGLRGFILPSQRPGTGEETSFEGATVLEPSCGFYRRPVSVLDFASLYPSIMMAHNLCYSTLLPAGAEKCPGAPDNAVAPAPAQPGSDSLSLPSSVAFVRSGVRRGLLPSILEQLLAARKAARRQLAACPPEQETRRKVLHGRQLALKLSANSVYGFTGAVNGPLPCLELAGAVTAYGRTMIQATKSQIESTFTRANGYAHDAEVIYGDTDSVMVCFGPDEFPLEEATRLSHEATKACTASFPAPICLEFEKVYHPYLLMNKKRYAGLAWTGVGAEPAMEMKGIETVRRDWSDLVRQGLERTLELLLRSDGGDGVAEAAAHVQGLCADLRQNKVDFRSLVISKSLGREDYAAKAPHVEVAARMRKRDPASAPSVGDRVNYLVLAGAAKAKVYERAEDPCYALENDLPIDAEYYLENQLKQPLIRVFELVLGSAEKAQQMLFGRGGGQKVVTATTAHGMGKFMKPKPKCLGCSATTVAAEKDAFCGACAQKGPAYDDEVREATLVRARSLRESLAALRARCGGQCALPSGPFAELPEDAPAAPAAGAPAEVCANINCPSIFSRVRVAKELKSVSESLVRLKVADW